MADRFHEGHERPAESIALGLLLLVAVIVLACSPGVQAQNFDWQATSGASVSGITPAMFLRDDNVAQVDAFLSLQKIKAIKIDTQLSPQTISSIFNKHKVDYTFVDYEAADAAQATALLVNQIRSSSATGPALQANQVYVSNFAFSPSAYDPTGPGTYAGKSNYFIAGVNMVSNDLYPGSPFYRNPASGNSTAPNIRSALFTLPVERLSVAAANLPAGHVMVPYVNRFNNWGNSALDSDGDSSNGYAFVTTGQLPSRGDFQAQVLHYRLRGAKAVQGLDGGVAGYTNQQFESDIQAGWNSISTFNTILTDPRSRLVTLDTAITVDGADHKLEDVGSVFSGAYSLSQGKMALLLSNLDQRSHQISIPGQIGGISAGGDYLVEGGEHRLLEFGLYGSTWGLTSNTAVFSDSNRAGIGVPEPSMLGLLAGMVLLAQRRRRA